MNTWERALQKKGWKEVTLWYMITETGLSFNHLEMGHAKGDKPKPKFPSQNGWKHGRWSKRHWFLDVNKSPAQVIV